MAFERRHIGHRGYALVSTALEREGVLAAFSERTGGVSAEPFASLNLSYSGDDDARNVAENRGRVVAGLRTGRFAVGGQVHGRRLGRVGPKRAGTGFEGPDGVVPRTDGLYTDAPGLPLAVLTADCVPVVLASAAERRVAVVHAGWRGIAAGILTAAAGVFEEPGGVRVAIGPAVGPCHYEVGEDVALAVAAASEAGAVVDRGRGPTRLDLVGTVRGILRGAGVGKVEDTGLCTACERRRFFSHRRDGPTGRQAAVVVRLE